MEDRQVRLGSPGGSPGSLEADHYATPKQQHEDVPATTSTPAVRRSGRNRKIRGQDLLMGDAGSEDELTSSPAAQKSPDLKEQPRRNPKRKAAPEIFDIPDDLLEAALAPVSPEELKEWEGWSELESDPSFFNVIIRDLGVKDVKIQELFSVDEDSLAILPKPVHGLIFLYQYVEEESQVTSETADGVWFANQTTSNACATVALLNIIMNTQNIELGDKLGEFKTLTANLAPPLRGWLLCNNKWIRTIHNSLARRFDLLNADLSLENAVDVAKKKSKALASKRGRKHRLNDDAAYHFIAYVPVDGQVYQLDGLESKPLPIGEYTDDWTAVARPFIETRMLQYESEQLSFNLLALCQSPLSALRRALAANMRSLARLESHRLANNNHDHDHDRANTNPTGAPGSSPIDPSDAARLREFGLREADVTTTAPLPSALAAAQEAEREPGVPDGEEEEARLRQLAAEQARLRAEYVGELAVMGEDAQRVAARREDYTLAIHTWVDMLASKGVLAELHEGTRG